METITRDIYDIRHEIETKKEDIKRLKKEIDDIMRNIISSIIARYKNEFFPEFEISGTENEISMSGMDYLNEKDIVFFNMIRETTGLCIFISKCENGLKVELYK